MRFALAAAALLLAIAPPPAAAARTTSDEITEGQLRAVAPSGRAVACPLKHTDVRADVSGFVARVTVTQQFENPFDQAIEAVYLFPLSGDAAVDRMTMRVGDRVVAGHVARRAEARAAYETARAEGKAASLLEQERPNVFTQSVANILPKARVEIEISYVETLRYEDGAYRFVFPMVVGQRYLPAALAKNAGPTRPATRAGHDVSVEVRVDAGVSIESIASTLHDIAIERPAERAAVVTLRDKQEVPNRDFVLTYKVAGGAIEDALVAHRDERGGFFSLILQPPARVAPADTTPKEVVFVLDTSGSMSGFPMEKAKETIRYALENLYPDDRFNVITFAGSTRVLFPEPVAATPANRAAAMKLLSTAQGRGGTEMMAAIREALEPSDRQDHVRVVCFITDGYVGNDMELLAEIQKHPNARVFAMGVGDAVNRFLLDKMAEEGRGEVDYVTLADDGETVARRFFERVRNPLLTDVEIDWNGLEVSELYPSRIPDLFGAKPVVVTGRYAKPGAATIRLKGRANGREVVREIAVELPETAPAADAIATVWARRRVDDLMRQDWAGVMARAPRDGIDEQIAQLGLTYGLMTQFTSFVAVDDQVVTAGGDPRRVDVGVERPEGVDAEVMVVTASGASTMHSEMSAFVATESVDVVAGEAAVDSAPGAGPGEGSGVGAGASAEKSVSVDGAEVRDLPVTGRTMEMVTLSAGSGGGRGRAGARAKDGFSARYDRSDASPAPARAAKPVIAAGAKPAAPWRRTSGRPGVEIVFAIDTTGSMGGLIDGAKQRIWGIVNEIMRSPCHPDVRIGIVAYRDRGDAYETQLLPLTADLDLVYDTLMGLHADGGGDTPENVRRGLDDAVRRMGWSPAKGDLAQVLFLVGDAPPHDDYADERATNVTAAEAARRGIVVHAIQCGEDQQTRGVWEAIAKHGAGAYFAVPAGAAVARVERTPFDAPLVDLGRQLGDLYTPYGTVAAQREASERQAARERKAVRAAARTTAADRAINKAVNAEAYAGDFLQAIENGTLRLERVARASLPEDLRGLSPAELRAEVARRIARRQSLRAAILDVTRLRDEFRSKAVDRSEETRFDETVGDSVKEHLKKKGIDCPE